MSETRVPKKLLVVEVVKDRPANPLYQGVAEHLTEAFLVTAGAEWQIELVAAGDVGTEELLKRGERADAIVILGGEDVHPKFSEQPEEYPGSGNHYEDADEAQIRLVQHAEKTGQPLLGICRGSQIVNVALGGKLVQHIESGDHRNANLVHDLTLITHPVKLNRETRIGHALATEGDTISVQSSHHQAADILGTDLVLAASAPDGIVEAFEHKSKPIFAVQWHPEDPKTDRKQLVELLELLKAEIQ